MGSRFRRVTGLFCCVALLSSAAKADDTTTPAFTRITIDLALATIENVLPFDVPFLFTGAITGTTKKITVAFHGISDQEKRAAEATAARKSDTTRGRVPLDFGCASKPDDAWTPLTTVLAPANSFTTSVPQLEANRYYCFKFEIEQEMSKADADDFRAKATTLVDTAFRSVGNGFLSNQELEQLRLRMVRAIQPKAAGRLVPIRNSIFEVIDVIREPGRAQDDAAIKNTFVELFQPIRQYQRNKAFGITSFSNKVTDASGSLLTWAKTEPLFGRMAATIGAAGAGSPAAAFAASNLPAIQHFAAASANDLVADVNGTASSEPFVDVQTPGDVDDRLTRLRATLAQLDAVGSVVGGLTTRAPLAAALGAEFTPAALGGLGGKISETRDLVSQEIAILIDLQAVVRGRQAAIATLMADVSTRLQTDVTLLATSVGDFQTRHSWYLSADLGLGWAWDLDEVFPYAGTNIYFRPVNKAAPLTTLGSFGQTFTRRFSAMIGLTVASNLAKDHERAALMGTNQMLVLGGGLRLTDSIRVAAGALVFKAFDPNPLIDNKRIRISPFLSFSVDWDVKGTITELGGRAAVAK